MDRNQRGGVALHVSLTRPVRGGGAQLPLSFSHTGARPVDTSSVGASLLISRDLTSLVSLVRSGADDIALLLAAVASWLQSAACRAAAVKFLDV